MKKLYAAITVLAISLSVGVTAMAQGKMSGKSSQKAGCSSCQKAGATPEQMKKFKADSIDLRQEMMNKRFDLQRENLKETPDSARVAAIKADMEAIKVKIDALKAAAGMPVSASCCMDDCPLMDGNCSTCSSKKGCSTSAGCCADCSKKGCCDKCTNAADCCCKTCSKKGKRAVK